MDAPRNRKQRRAAAAAASSSGNDSSFDPSSIPLARPPRDDSPKNGPDGRTLLQVIEERQKELLKKQGISLASPESDSTPLETKFVTVDPSGKISGFDPTDNFESPSAKQSGEKQKPDESSEMDESLPPFVDTVLLSLPLSGLHLTLAYLAAHQYAQEIQFGELVQETAFIAFPVLTLLLHLAHGHIVSFGKKSDNRGGISLFPLRRDKLTISFLWKLLFPPSLRTLVFLPLSVFLGIKLMTMTNEDPYYAVMKRAPAVGTLWVWCILEMPVGGALFGALAPLGWGVYGKGYGIF